MMRADVAVTTSIAAAIAVVLSVSAVVIPDPPFQGPVYPGYINHDGVSHRCSAFPDDPDCAVANKIVVLHTNDVHSHYDETNGGGVPCSPAAKQDNYCYGGVARIKTLVDQYRATNDNVLLLDAGDQIVGTLFYNRYGFEPSVEFMNELKYDAMSIGNHEFDENVTFAADFIKELQFPVLSSNIDFSTARELYDQGMRPFLVIEKYSLGIIGYITNTTSDISIGAHNVTFYDPVNQVQEYVDILRRKHGVRRIICVSHNGYDEDQYLAANTQGIDLIVGGHSHTLLSSNASLPGVKGPYPTAVKSLDGKTTWVVQAHRYADYLGHIELEWDEHGHLLAPRGEAILLDQSIPQDPKIQARVEELAEGFSELTSQVVGTSTGDFVAENCYAEECPMGDFITDCMLSEPSSGGAQIGFINAGGIRASFAQGNITYADVYSVMPFGNLIASFEHTGAQVLEILERSVSGHVVSILQWGGIRWSYNPAAPVGSRVRSATVGDAPLDVTRTYTVATIDFVANGGDNILNATAFTPGVVLADAIISCLGRNNPITPKVDGRVVTTSSLVQQRLV